MRIGLGRKHTKKETNTHTHTHTHTRTQFASKNGCTCGCCHKTCQQTTNDLYTLIDNLCERNSKHRATKCSRDHIYLARAVDKHDARLFLRSIARQRNGQHRKNAVVSYTFQQHLRTHHVSVSLAIGQHLLCRGAISV